VSCSLRPVGRAQRARLERLTAATGLFRPDEVAIAVELLDESLAGGDDYRLLGAYAGDELVGYACWGPTPGTQGTYDLYWIVVDPVWQGKRIGTELLRAVEDTLTAAHGRLIVVETSSRAAYAPTRAFYERRGYARTATIPGYYAPDDDLVIYRKDLMHGVLASATA
jgi:ribosomal protein S18 acetylase RimI-like enzyme